jgi:membrane glycosyltransferase
MAILLAPKFFGLLLMMMRRDGRRACGGGLRLLVSAFIEIVISALVAPILMLIQSGSVFQILLGRDTGWQPQRRDDGSIPLRDIVRRHRWHTLLGCVAAVSAFSIATSLLLWMSPTLIGLLLAIPLSWLSGRLAVGLFLKRFKLLMTPEEAVPPAIVTRANGLQEDLARDGYDDQDGLVALCRDPILREQHEAMLPPATPRKRGEIDADRALAQAKLVEADTLEDATRWLKPKERIVVLHDRALLDVATRLKPAALAAE